MGTGVDSIRIKGKAIQDLPLGMGNEAKEQLPAAIETERLNNIATINANFPTHRIDYLVGRIKECRKNKERMDLTISQQNTMISDYKGHIAMCTYRDKKIVELDQELIETEIANDTLSDYDLKEHSAAVKELFKQFPPYKVDAMEQQIVQCGEAIERCIVVKDKEDASILEFTEVVALCKQRDKELAWFGAVAEG